MIAALGMYDFPWLHAANDALWGAIAARLDRAPPRLTRDRELAAIWSAPDLLLAQTCGYPLTHGIEAQVVAVPIHDAPGCEGAWHRSALIVRRDDPAQTLSDCFGARAAVNAPDSNTGMNLLRATVAPYAREGRFFGAIVQTGAHRRSLAAVIGRCADIAAIDAVTWALMQDRYRGLAARLRVLDWSEPSPGLPLITAASRTAHELAALRDALTGAIADPALAAARAALRLRGFAMLARADYDRIIAIEAAARRAGYPELA